MLIDFKVGTAGITLRIKLRNAATTSGAGLTGLSSASAGLVIAAIADNEATTTAYTVAALNVEGITTLGAYETPTAGKCRIEEVDAIFHPGIYEVHLANARYAVSGAKSLHVSIHGATNLAECDFIVPLRAVDPYAANFGLANVTADIVQVDGVTFGPHTAGMVPAQMLDFDAALAGNLDEIADAVLGRDAGNVDATAGATVGSGSIYTLIRAFMKWSLTNNPGFFVAYRVDGVTPHVTLPVVPTANPDGISEMG